jgi:hypothetical protein
MMVAMGGLLLAMKEDYREPPGVGGLAKAGPRVAPLVVGPIMIK